MSPAPNHFRFPPVSAPFFFLFFGKRAAAAGIFLSLATGALAQTNLAGNYPASPLPDAGASFIRVLGGLALVLGLFLGGVWLFKNWQRVSARNGIAPKLHLLESRSLGARQGIVVVGYDKQRFLVATSPAGVNLLSHLPDADISETENAKSAPAPFAQALAQVLKGK